MYRSGKKLILLHSNSLKVMNYWAKKSLNNLKKQNSANIYILDVLMKDSLIPLMQFLKLLSILFLHMMKDGMMKILL